MNVASRENSCETACATGPGAAEQYRRSVVVLVLASFTALAVVSLAHRACTGKPPTVDQVSRLPAPQPEQEPRLIARFDDDAVCQGCDDADCDYCNCDACYDCNCADYECDDEGQGAFQIPVFPAAVQIGTISHNGQHGPIQRCQAFGEEQLHSSRRQSVFAAQAAPSADDAEIERAEELIESDDFRVIPDEILEEGPVYCPRIGVDCEADDPCGHLDWSAERLIPWEVFAQGEYIGPVRAPDVPVYRVRVDDQLDFVFRLTREKWTRPYRFDVGDVILVESLVAEENNREVTIGPDGMATLPLVGQVPAAGRTINEVRDDLEERYKNAGVREPTITVTPLKFNTRLEELRNTVDRRFGQGGQSQPSRVAPDGTVQLPALEPILVQGLTLHELKREVDARYAELVQGLEVTPILVERAPRFIYVLGEVRTPGRFVLEAPTTAMQAIALAGGWNVGARLNQIVVFRRDADWRLMATRLNLRQAVWGKEPCPPDEIWLRDSDIVLLPKSSVLLATDFIDLVFTRGIYGVIPMNGISINFAKLGTL